MNDVMILSQKFPYLSLKLANIRLQKISSLEMCMKAEYKKVYIYKLMKQTIFTFAEANYLLLRYSIEECMNLFLCKPITPRFNLYKHILDHEPFHINEAFMTVDILSRKYRKFMNETQLPFDKAYMILKDNSFKQAMHLYKNIQHVVENTDFIFTDVIVMLSVSTPEECVKRHADAKMLMRQTNYSYGQSIEMLQDNTVEQCITIYLEVPLKIEKLLSTNQLKYQVIRELY